MSNWETNEVFMCLYCQRVLIGDEEWNAHRREAGHAAARAYEDYKHTHAASLPEPLE